jgi:hypothetical protein
MNDLDLFVNELKSSRKFVDSIPDNHLVMVLEHITDLINARVNTSKTRFVAKNRLTK